MNNHNIIIFIICLSISTSFTCKRSIIESEDGIIINICPYTKKECVSWMYIEKMPHKNHDFKTLGIYMYPNTYHISEPTEITNFTLYKILLSKWNEGDLYHISIGVQRTCKHHENIETIYIDDSLLVKGTHEIEEHGSNNVTTFISSEKNITRIFSDYYKTYTYIVIPICTIFILIIVIYITCNRACIFKKHIRKIDDIEDFIMIKLHQEKEPLFNSIEGIDEDSDEDDY
ncbi:hypothetical protein [Fowlpox virus]|nr:hypothetical protein [Fowlpox virus]